VPGAAYGGLAAARELTEQDLAVRVSGFLEGDFAAFDAELAEALRQVPDQQPAPEPDSSEHEVTGWLELYERQDYRTAEEVFRARQEDCSRRDIRELGAFAQFTEAKAAFLEGRRGDRAAAAPRLKRWSGPSIGAARSRPGSIGCGPRCCGTGRTRPPRP